MNFVVKGFLYLETILFSEVLIIYILNFFSCDGSFEVVSTIETDISLGVHRGSSK